MEVWKKVDGYGDKYWISSYGRMKVKGYGIKSVRVNSKGYAYFRMKWENRVYRKPIHRFVAEYFIEKPIGKDYVNHIDGNKLNNRVENLEWCTMEENQAHAYKNNLCAKMPMAVRQYSLSNEFVKDWFSVRQAVLAGFGHSTGILKCCRGKINECGGFIWRFLDERLQA